MKRKIVLTLLTIILLINTIFGVINVHKLLSMYYPIENYKIINTILDDYSNILAIENVTSDEIVFFCSQYWVQDEVYDDWSVIVDINDTRFDPRTCLELMKKTESLVDNENLKLSFRFSNGTLITFKDYRDKHFTTVVIDNSQAIGYVIPNISYYSEYTCFDRYEIYGSFHDITRSDEEFSSGDKSILEHIGVSATIVMDEYTYNEVYLRYYDQELVFDTFGELVEYYCDNEDNLVIERGCSRVYDRSQKEASNGVPVVVYFVETEERPSFICTTSENEIKIHTHFETRGELAKPVIIFVIIEVIAIVALILAIKPPIKKRLIT